MAEGTTEYEINLALAASKDEQKQKETLLALLRSGSMRHQHAIHFMPVCDHCLNASSKLVRRLAYSFLRNCTDYGGEGWATLMAMVLRDISPQNPQDISADDADLSVAALRSLSSIPSCTVAPTLKDLSTAAMRLLSSRHTRLRHATAIAVGQLVVSVRESGDGCLEPLTLLSGALVLRLSDSSAAVAAAAFTALARLCRFAQAAGGYLGEHVRLPSVGLQGACRIILPEPADGEGKDELNTHIASCVIAALSDKLEMMVGRMESLPLRERRGAVRLVVLVGVSLVLAPQDNTAAQRVQASVAAVTDNHLAPLLHALDAGLVLEGSRALLELSRVLPEGRGRWPFLVARSCLLAMKRRSSDSGSEALLRATLIAFRLLPATQQELLTPDLLHEIMAVETRGVRVDGLLICLWTAVWAEGVSSNTILHNKAVMRLIQDDPDKVSAVREEFVAAFAQASLLPPPPRVHPHAFDEGLAIDFLELWHGCLRWRGHGCVEAARLYLQLLARCCARAWQRGKLNATASSGGFGRVGSGESGTGSAGGEETAGLDHSTRLQQILQSVMASCSSMRFESPRTRVLSILCDFLDLPPPPAPAPLQKGRAKPPQDVGHHLVSMLRRHLLGVDAQERGQKRMLAGARSGLLNGLGRKAVDLRAGNVDAELIAQCMLKAVSRRPDLTPAVEAALAEALSHARFKQDGSLRQRLLLAQRQLKDSSGDAGMLRKLENTFAFPYGLWPNTACAPPSEEDVHQSNPRRGLPPPDDLWPGGGGGGQDREDGGSFRAEGGKGGGQTLDALIQDSLWRVWGNLIESKAENAGESVVAGGAAAGEKDFVAGVPVLSGSSDAMHVEVKHSVLPATRRVTLSIAITNRSALEFPALSLRLALGAGLRFTDLQIRASTVIPSLEAGGQREWTVALEAVALHAPTATLHISGGGMELKCRPFKLPVMDLLCPFPEQAVAGHAEVQTLLRLWSALRYWHAVHASAHGFNAAERINHALDRAPCARVVPGFAPPSAEEEQSDLGLLGGSAAAATRPSFHSCAASQTWFEDYLALGITGNYEAASDRWVFRIELRVSSAVTLSALTQAEQLTEVIRVMCGGHLTMTPPDAAPSRAPATSSLAHNDVVARWRTARALSAHHRIPLPSSTA